MNRFLKYGLLTAGGVVLVVAGGAAYVVATFNPNDYKPQIIRAVKDKTQRTLRLDGNIKLTFFPSIGADIGKVSLSELGSDQEFAALDSAHVALALLPLFSRQAVVDEVTVNGLKLTWVKLKSGKTNIDDLLHKDGSRPEGKAEEQQENKSAASPVKLDIAAVHVEKTELDYRDETSGAQYALKNITLNTGHIAYGAPTKIDFSATLHSDKPRLDVSAQLKTTLTLDLDKQAWRLEGLDLQAKGALAGMGDLAVSLATPDLQGDAQALKSSALNLQLDMKQPEQAFQVKLSTPVSGDFKSQQFSLPNFAVAVHATGDRLPGKSVSSEMKGSVQVDAAKQNVQMELAGGLLQSQIKARVAMNNFADPAFHFDADVDQFDADVYLLKKAEGASAGAGASKVAGAPATEPPLDLSALKKLNLDGSLRVGALKVANLKSSQVHLDVKAHNGVLNLNPLSAKLYDGSMNGSITVNAAQATPGFAINENLSGISIAPLLKDIANFDTLEGKGNVALKLDTQGNTVGALKKLLNGSMVLNLADGAVKGINIAKTLRSFGKSGGSQTQVANKDEKTDFSELKASFKVNNGIAHNDDLSLKSPLLRLSGNGDINLGNDSINYLAKATLAGTLEGQGGKDSVGGLTVPVRLSGPFTDLKYTLDFGAMVSEAAKQKIEAKKQEVKGKLMDQLKGGLKGLFR
ncbi:MAG: AsmA family protein [Nitrosomonadales bacterium]|nr:AsmA family protein [Nitrosomonadales bacterium]